MAKQFDPRAVLKQLAKPLLQELFRRRNELQHLPWEELRNGRSVEEIYTALQQLPEERLGQVQVVLRDLDQVADDRGIRAFADEIQKQAPQFAWQFASCRTRMNKALWFYLTFPEVFKRASLFALADNLANGRYAKRCKGLPKEPLVVTPEMTAKLAHSLREYYWLHEMRGDKCRVSHYGRPDGSEYFFAYLDDWPGSRLVFSDEGELLSKIERYAFSVVFVVNPEHGSLDLIARGNSALKAELQRRFCEAMYQPPVQPAEPRRPTYRLQHLLDPNFRYPTLPTDCIGRVRLTRIVLQMPPNKRGLTEVTLNFGPEARRQDWLREIDLFLRRRHLSTSDVIVRAATFELTFTPCGLAPRKTMKFRVRLPSSCDLKSKPDEMRVIGERCLIMWEIYCA